MTALLCRYCRSQANVIAGVCNGCAADINTYGLTEFLRHREENKRFLLDDLDMLDVLPRHAPPAARPAAPAIAAADPRVDRRDERDEPDFAEAAKNAAEAMDELARKRGRG